MKGFNLSKFKKIKEDKDWATLIHEDGHSINIAKAPLSPIQRKQLENLQMHMAQGGKVMHYDEGTGNAISPDVESSNDDDSAEPSLQAPQSPTAPVRAPSGAQNTLEAQVPGYQAEQKANIAGAEAVGKQGAETAQALQDNSNALSQLPTQSQIFNSYRDSDARLSQAYQDKTLNPDHYWEDHSKVAAGIGILLSGVGQVLGQGKIQDNAALQAIHDGVNREILKQQNSQQQSMNLWKMNREALGSDLAANLATQNQLYTGLQYKIQKVASQNQGPIALAKAQAANAIIDQNIQANRFKLSLLTPTSDNPDPASRIQFLVPPDRQQKVVDEINAAKNTVANSPGIMDAFDQAAQEVRPLTGGMHTSGTAFVPGIKSPGQQALQARLGPTFQDVEGTVRQAAMDNLDHNVTPKFGDDDSTIATKRQSLVDYMKSKSAAAASKSFGIDLTKYPNTNTTSIGQHASPAVSTAQYQRQVINGKAYMVPVK